MSKNILIAGCGYVGIPLGNFLVDEGHRVFGVRRRAEELPDAFHQIRADLLSDDLESLLPEVIDRVVYLVSADGYTEEAYRNAYVRGLQRLTEALDSISSGPERILFASSTAVYGQQEGEWVDETSPTRPASFSGRVLLEGEQFVRERFSRGMAVRFGGIYGPGRTRMIESVRQGEAFCYGEEPHYTNRNHRDDCAGALQHLLFLEDPEDIYIGVDNEPADRCEVLRWIARQIDADPPEQKPSEEASPRIKASSKRCDNSRLKATGFTFTYPTFREGYRDLLPSQT